MKSSAFESLIGAAVIAVAGGFLFFAYQSTGLGHAGRADALAAAFPARQPQPAGGAALLAVTAARHADDPWTHCLRDGNDGSPLAIVHLAGLVRIDKVVA